MTSTADEGANLEVAEGLIRRAASRGARLVATPENTNFLGPQADKVRRAEPLEGSLIARFAALARELGIWLLLGSFNERGDEQRCRNTSVLFSPDGERAAVYRKIHLFDVDVSLEVRFQESATVASGEDIVVAATPLGAIGMTICYDLRFPELYRALVDRGAQLITVPSAFTLTTGRAHWHTLLRARAIECQCYVIAPAQIGHHDDDGIRHSFGHSLIIDPWGQEIAMAPDGPGLALAEIDLARVDEIRRKIPTAKHRRLEPPGTPRV